MQGPDFVRMLWGLAAGILLFGLAAAFIRSRPSASSPSSPATALGPVVVPSSTLKPVLPPAPRLEREPAQPLAPVPAEPPRLADPAASPTTAPTSGASAAAYPATSRSITTAKPKTSAKPGDVTQSDIDKMERRLRDMEADMDGKARDDAEWPSAPPSQTARPARKTLF